jgi:hypothetical protein
MMHIAVSNSSKTKSPAVETTAAGDKIYKDYCDWHNQYSEISHN